MTVYDYYAWSPDSSELVSSVTVEDPAIKMVDH